jgi:hypothetical protein
MRLRYTIRGLLLVILIIGITIGWWFDHKRLSDKIAEISPQIQPASTIEGQVTYSNTGKPAVGARVIAQAIAAFAGARADYCNARTDNEGRFRFVNLAPSNYNIWAEVDGWTMNAIDSLPVVAGQAIKDANLKLVEGGMIKGRVIDEKTGKGVSFAHSLPVAIGVYGPARPRTGPAVQCTTVDSNGGFQLRVPAGKNFPYVMSVHPQYVVKGSEYQEDGVLLEDGKTTEIEFVIKVTP